jgi:hypothetical protein
MEHYGYQVKTVTPKEILSLSSLFLRWPYKTKDIIKKEMNTLLKEGYSQTRITIYGLSNIYYQNAPVEQLEYKGFLLKIDFLEFFRSEFNFEDYLNNFANCFVLKQDILAIEKTNREYCALPPNHKKFKDEICSLKNLQSLIPQILYNILNISNKCSFDKIKQLTIPEEQIWPWLGPIAPKITESEVKRTIPEDLEEIQFFIKAARELGQNNPKCLAQMIKYRYPEVSHPTLVDLIDPLHQGNAAAKRQQGRRWLRKN